MYKIRKKNILYYLLFFLIPFSQTIPVFSLSGREVNLGFDTILIAIIIIRELLKKNIKIYSLPNDPVSLTLLFIALWNICSMIFALRYLTVAQFADCFIVFIRWGQYIPIYYLLVKAKDDFNDYNIFISLLLLSGIIVSLWGIYEIIFQPNPEYFRGAVTFTRPIFREHDLAALTDETGYHGSANYNVAGAYQLIATIIVTPFLFLDRSLFKKIKGFLLLLLLSMGVLVTYSRSAAIALLIGEIFLLFNYSKKYLFYILCVCLIVTLLFLQNLKDVWLIPNFVETVTNLPEMIPQVLSGYHIWEPSMGASTNVFGAAMRLVAFIKAFETFITFPLIGCGFFAFKYYNPNYQTAENYFLQTLAETGIVGGTLLVALFYFLYKMSASVKTQISFKNRFKVGFRSLLIVMIIVNMTGTMFYVQKIWGVFLLLSAILVSISKENIPTKSSPAANVMS